MTDVSLPLLQRREIEARIVAPIVRDLADRFGTEAVLAVVADTVRRLAAASGAEVAAELGANGLDDLARVLAIWNAGGALETEMVRADDQHFDFDVKRCRFAEMYHRLGLAELGPVLSCNRDFCFAEGFNPDMELERTQTIMEGATHCDFRFTLRKGDGD